jgi:hypothetical protein
MAGVDVVADFEKLQEDTGSIRGRVTFRGAWSDSVEEVRVVVYADYPPTNFFLIHGWSDAIPLGVSEYAYRISLMPGTYELVFVICRKEGQFWGPETVRGFLGMYVDPSDSMRPGVVQVRRRWDTTGIDIEADFDNMGVLPPELEEAVRSQGG